MTTDAGVTPESYRRALSYLAGGVVIVTTCGADGEPRGMTATAVCSVSIEPPLVMACMSQAAVTHVAVEASGVFALNILPADAQELAQRFASSSEDKFSGVRTVAGASGAPLLADALAHCDCEVEDAIIAGDHTIFIGRVLSASARSHEDRRGGPLLYCRGAYGSMGLPDGAASPPDGAERP